jgi:hypothetical protein
MSKIRYAIDLGLVGLVFTTAFLAVLVSGSLADDLQGYNPVYSQGSGKDDWWVKYPDQSLDSGSTVNHLPWVITDLKEKPVILFIHTSDCKACKVQK